jgi:hypothetical protein
VRSPSAVRRAATELGGCVALKAVAPGLVHKSERSAVRLNLGPTAAERAARELAATIGELEAFLVQPMAPPGAELLVGTTTDSRFGPLVAVGAGGTTAELAGDAQLRLAPVGPREAAAMLRELRCFPLLDGFRGRPVADTAAVEALIVRIGALAAAHPAVAELDCNPVIAGPGGALVVDARIRLQAPPPSPPFGALDA